MKYSVSVLPYSLVLFFLAHEETGVSLTKCFSQMFDILSCYIKSGINERVKSCSDCDAYDSEREGCTMPSCDMDYACPLNGGFDEKN